MTTARPASPYASIAIVGLLFFIMGFFTWINGPLILFAKVAFNVSDTFAFLIPSAFYISYFCLALPSSLILKLTGMKKGLALSLLIMAIGAAIFGQFTNARSYVGAVSGMLVVARWRVVGLVVGTLLVSACLTGWFAPLWLR